MFRASVLSLLCLLLLLYGLFCTEEGSNFVMTRLAPHWIAGYELSEFSGTLNESFTVTNLKLKHANYTLEAEKLTLSWKPFSLLKAKINIHSFSLDNFKLTLPDNQQTDFLETLDFEKIAL